LYEEWKGEGNLNFIGGISELEKNFQNKWRNDFNVQEQKYFSRLKFVMNYVENKIQKGKLLKDIIQELDEQYPGASVSTAEKALKKNK
jgi:hypothetical protein